MLDASLKNSKFEARNSKQIRVRIRTLLTGVTEIQKFKTGGRGRTKHSSHRHPRPETGKEQSVPHVGTPAQRTGLNTTTGGASGWRVECEYEEDTGLYVNVDDLWHLVAG